MMYVGAAILMLVGLSGFAVVRTRDVTAQVIALGFYGLFDSADVLLLPSSRCGAFAGDSGRGGVATHGDAGDITHAISHNGARAAQDAKRSPTRRTRRRT